ncbi:hypothetical protein ATZ99_06580 [Thermovenabulum gondwanense]|uniref:Uncharacterized protein n=1 Tax=Thermovenabulum gondwanense TaxID=520767 RepID=A0A162MUH8_9FIRM|nr:hypothetical protein ATZ99_06580 [Thermovenabulum gondwanense]
MDITLFSEELFLLLQEFFNDFTYGAAYMEH